MLSRDEVIWGYRYILGREVDDEKVIAEHIRTVPDWQVFRQALLTLAAFSRRRNEISGSHWVASEILDGQRMLWLDLHDEYVSLGCLHDHYSPVVTATLRRYLQPHSVFLDIGANIGWFSMVASTIIGSAGHIHAFEPRQPTADYLRRSVVMNRLESRITVHDYGLDRENGDGHLGWRPEERNPGHSFLTDAAGQPGMTIHPVTLKRLDTLNLGRVDVIKIDVEGAEMRVMSGGQAIIETNRPVILAELYPRQLEKLSGISAAEFIFWFTSRGYRAVIADERRQGEEIHDFPLDWPIELADIVLLPDARPF